MDDDTRIVSEVASMDNCLTNRSGTFAPAFLALF